LGVVDLDWDFVDSLFNADLIGGVAVLITMPFTLYLLANRGGLISQRMLLAVIRYFTTWPDEYGDVVQDVLKEEV